MEYGRTQLLLKAPRYINNLLVPAYLNRRLSREKLLINVLSSVAINSQITLVRTLQRSCVAFFASQLACIAAPL